MKVRVDFTVEVDNAAVRAYMVEAGINGETVADFVRSHMISSAVGVFEETLRDTTGEYVNVGIARSNLFDD